MTWPSPTLPPPDADEQLDARAETTPPPVPPESPDDRRRLSAVPAAAWVAVVGGALVIVAAAIVVASNWDSIGRGFRVGGLVLATTGLLTVSERLRQVVPTSAGVIAHVGTFLAAPVGIAVMSLFGFTWPTCLLVGGMLAVIATELQAARWSRVTFHLAQTVALALAAVGFAALTGTTAGFVAAVAAAALLALGAQRRAAALSLLALFSPVLTAVADAGIGAGTLLRAGLVGESLGWSGPVVGLLTALVFGTVARERRSSALTLAAAAAPVVGLVTGLAAVDGPVSAWLCVPALVVIALEIARRALPSERGSEFVDLVADIAAGVLGAGALLGPWIVDQVELTGVAFEHPWAVPAVVTTLALALATLRWRESDRPVSDAGLAVTLAAAIATVAALGAPGAVVAALAIVATAAGAFLSRRIHPAPVYVPAFWAVLAIASIEPATELRLAIGAGALLGALLLVVAASRARLAAAAGWLGWIEAIGVIVVTAIAATEFVVDQRPLAALVGATVAGLALVATERRLLAATLTAWTACGLVTLDAAAGTAGIDAGYWIGWASLTAGGVVLWSLTRSTIAAHASAAGAVMTAAIASEALAISVEQFVGMAMIGTVALTGVALALQRRTPVDAAAVTAGVVLAASSWFDIDPTVVSAIWVVVGLQVWSYGFATRRPWLHLAGALTSVGALVSWWFTSGLHDWALDLIEPADIRVSDLWMLAATTIALLAGHAVRSTLHPSSWLAYSPGLVIGAVWLLSVEIERDPVWAIPAALTFGIAALAVGAWRRLAAPLVGGTAITAATVFVASGSDLRAIPTWSWLAASGLALLAIAVLIERTGKGGAAELRNLVDRWE